MITPQTTAATRGAALRTRFPASITVAAFFTGFYLVAAAIAVAVVGRSSTPRM